MPTTTAYQWLSLVGVIWLQSISGTNLNFPAYSTQLKHVLSVSQMQLNSLAFASDAGKLLGWFSGIAAIYLPLWLVLMIGSSLGLVGYGLQYLSVIKQISPLSYWQIFLLTVLAGNSICWINTVSYVISIRNFPNNRQVAVGITTSYQGLSAKVYTDVVIAVMYYSQFRKVEIFLLLNSIFPVIVSVITALLLREIDLGRPKNMDFGFIVMFVITTTTGVYAVISSLRSNSALTELLALENVIGTGAFLLAPLAIPIAAKIRQELVGRLNLNRERKIYHFTIEENDVKSEENDVTIEENEVIERTENGIKKEEDGIEINKIGVREEVGVKVMLMRVDFWLYFMVYFCSATLGLVFLNNLGQIAESRGSSSTSSLVSLSSSFGFFGRLMSSLLDYYFSRTKYMVSKPTLIVIFVAPMSGAFFLLLNSNTLSLNISTAIIGICTGAITSISVSTTTELFGTKNFSVNHNVLVANIPLGSLVFGYLAGFLYHKEGNGDGKCLGMECYKKTFIIWGSLCFLGTILALILYARTRKLYSQRL